MSIEEYADRFRIRHPTIPERLYGRLAKIENVTAQAKLAQEEKDKQGGVIPTEIVATNQPESRLPLTSGAATLKLSLPRDSNSGTGWVRAPRPVAEANNAVKDNPTRMCLPKT